MSHATPSPPRTPEAEDGCAVLKHNPLLLGCRSVDAFERLNRIDEGTYGVVFRARDTLSGEVVAVKQVKLSQEREGFPITSLREINILLTFDHPNIVKVHEMVVGSTADKIFMVMEFMDHEVKTLLEDVRHPFSQSEVKCLMLQLLRAVDYMHSRWIIHRDLKTSNLLYNNKGVLKVCDFGLARKYGSPIQPYTHMVVTLWYRAPELLLGQKEYTPAIDMWSVGCIFAELLLREPLLPGKGELDQIDKIFRLLGTPTERTWPGYSKLPAVQKIRFSTYPYNRLRDKIPRQSFTGGPYLTDTGLDLLSRLLCYDPERRITASEALNHPWFTEFPSPQDVDMMPTFPSANEQSRDKKRRRRSLDEEQIKERAAFHDGEERFSIMDNRVNERAYARLLSKGSNSKPTQ